MQIPGHTIKTYSADLGGNRIIRVKKQYLENFSKCGPAASALASPVNSLELNHNQIH